VCVGDEQPRDAALERAAEQLLDLFCDVFLERQRLFATADDLSLRVVCELMQDDCVALRVADVHPAVGAPDQVAVKRDPGPIEPAFEISKSVSPPRSAIA
jgi:hypothetical protein